ncbi:MAG: hypothetical protein KC964_13025 [Candidatus Omnitrophica bacterium]|nr:hypothetical protein [Candidatus Omnitrophota bacterium]
MKKLALVVAGLWLTGAQAAQIGMLASNHEFNIYQDGDLVETVFSQDSMVNLELPSGKHTIELIDMGPMPTSTATPSPTFSPTPSPTNPVVIDPTATPTPSPTAEPTVQEEGLEVFVASYNEDTQRNRFQVIDASGKSMAPYIEVLEGVPGEGQVQVADLDGDGMKEIIAFGASSTGIVLEYWNGMGELLQSRSTLSRFHYFDIHLQTCDFDGEPGEEVIVMGRNQSGIYRFEAYDSAGTAVATYPSIILGYNVIQGFAMDDVDGDGQTEVVVFGRTNQDQIEATVIGMEGVDDPVTLFGKGYSVTGDGFTVDLDGDGVYEIGSVARNGRASFRLIVTDVYGQIRLKKNVLSSKFDDQVSACAADVNGDGREEIVISGRLGETGENIVQVFDHDGYQVVAHTYLDAGFRGKPINLFSDLDQDDSLEFIVAGRDSLTGMGAYQVYDAGQTEMVYGGFLLENGLVEDPKVMAKDVNMDGVEELLVTGKLNGGAYAVEMRDIEAGNVIFQSVFSTRVLSVSAGALN